MVVVSQTHSPTVLAVLTAAFILVQALLLQLSTIVNGCHVSLASLLSLINADGTRGLPAPKDATASQRGPTLRSDHKTPVSFILDSSTFVMHRCLCLFRKRGQEGRKTKVDGKCSRENKREIVFRRS